MKINNVVRSNEAPNVKNCIWAKPIANGFVLYMLEGGMWKPLQVVDSKNTPLLADDTAFTPAAIKETINDILGVSIGDTNLSLAGLRDALNETRAGILALITANNLTGLTGDDASAFTEYDPDYIDVPWHDVGENPNAGTPTTGNDPIHSQVP